MPKLQGLHRLQLKIKDKKGVFMKITYKSFLVLCFSVLLANSHDALGNKMHSTSNFHFELQTPILLNSRNSDDGDASVERVKPFLFKIYSGINRNVVYQNPNDRPFVEGIIQDIDFKEANSNYLVKKKRIKKHCKKPKVSSFSKSGETVSLKGFFEDRKCHLSFAATFRDVSRSRLEFEIKFDEAQPFSDAFKLKLNFSKNGDKNFFGFGAQASYVNLNGQRVRILSTEQGHGRGLQPYTRLANLVTPGVAGDSVSTYAPVPFTFTEKSRGLYLKNYEYSEFDLKSKYNGSIYLAGNSLRGEFLATKNMLDMLTVFTDVSGRMKALPDWSHKGAVLGLMGGSKLVRKKLDRYKKFGLDISSLWLQDWVGQRQTSLATRLWWNWTPDRKSYPDWEKLITDLKMQDIEMMAYINPFLTPVEDDYEPIKNLWAEANRRGFLVKSLEGEPVAIPSGGFNGYLIDFTNPEARDWIKSIIKKEFLEKGVMGWMADFAEALPMDTELYDGSNSASYHNRYPYEWALIQKEALNEFKAKNPDAYTNRKPVIFHRSGFTKSPSTVDLFWLGDQLVSWDEHDGLESSITALLSSGLSGQTINHSDIGGYITIDLPLVPKIKRSRELMKRWTELNAFSAFFRTHEGTNPEAGIQFDSDDEILAFFTYYTKVFKSLFEYRKVLFNEAENFGYPVVRPLFLHYPNDSKAYINDYQYLLGSDLLVSPVTKDKARKKTVYLPEGQWKDLWSGEVKRVGPEGLTLEVSAPLGRIPAYYKASNQMLEDIAKKIRALPKPF